jgi:hypothetical protein
LTRHLIAAIFRNAIEIAGGVDNEAQRERTVTLTAEPVEYGKLAAAIQLIYSSAAFLRVPVAGGLAREFAPEARNAVKVTLAVEHYASLRLYSVLSIEIMKHREFSVWRDFEQTSAA